jgi:hypothetical protein
MIRKAILFMVLALTALTVARVPAPNIQVAHDPLPCPECEIGFPP